jgi:hypothetical protein
MNLKKILPPMKNRKQQQPAHNADEKKNKSQQAADKSPGKERNKREKVSIKDMKGKKVDADTGRHSDQPAD